MGTAIRRNHGGLQEGVDGGDSTLQSRCPGCHTWATSVLHTEALQRWEDISAGESLPSELFGCLATKATTPFQRVLPPLPDNLACFLLSKSLKEYQQLEI